MKKRTFIPTISLITAIAVIAFLVLLHFVFRVNINLALLVAVVFTVVLLLIFFSLDSMRIETNKEIEENLNNVYREILNDGEMGIIMYDNNYEVTYLSQFFADRAQLLAQSLSVASVHRRYSYQIAQCARCIVCQVFQ